MYPSEHAYHKDSVESDRVESNCRKYSPGNLPGGEHPENYIHCDGTQLKLADSNFGQEQYQSSDYHVWPVGSDAELLFILPTRVSLTTITLHYYSDSDRGLPRLTFYAVPDDFDVWNAPDSSNPHADVASVPPGGEPAGHRSISINVNFNTKKVLMYKHSSTKSFQFAVSEVEFFTCKLPGVDVREEERECHTLCCHVQTLFEEYRGQHVQNCTQNALNYPQMSGLVIQLP